MKRILLWPIFRVCMFSALIWFVLLHINLMKGNTVQSYTAKRYQGTGDLHYAHISCYWESGLDLYSLEQAKERLSEELELVFGETPPFLMAWGSQSTTTITQQAHSSSAEVYRVSKDFFQVFPFPFIRGSSQNMKPFDIVLNEQAAWDLFGSTDCVGMEFEVDGQFYRVQAVCQTANTISQFFFTNPDTDITFCEIILPELWNGFAKNIVSGVFSIDSGEIRNNTSSFSASSLWAGAIEMLQGIQQVPPIKYPVWARQLNHMLQRLYLQTALFVILVVHWALSTIKLIVIIVRNYKRFPPAENVKKHIIKRRSL